MATDIYGRETNYIINSDGSATLIVFDIISGKSEESFRIDWNKDSAPGEEKAIESANGLIPEWALNQNR
jgi:hypothetical protein